jgi:hypothetical protein
MGSVHLRLNHDEAVYAKKELLKAELSLLEMTRGMRSYKILRRKEFTEKNKVKKALKSLRQHMARLETEMPRIEEVEVPTKKLKKELYKEQGKEIPQPTPKKQVKRTPKKKRDVDKLHEEINDIKSRLSKLT